MGIGGNRILAETTGTTPGESPSPYRQVQGLNANVPIAKFRDILGRESSWTYLRDGRSYLFITQDYCVEAIADAHGLVVMFTVTTLSADFKPTFRYYGGDSETERVTLGETTFAECDSWGPPSSIWSYLYANRYCYSEAFHLPSAANGVTILLANNYMGAPQTMNFDGLMGIYGRVTRHQAKKAAAGRSTSIVNTYGVCAPDDKYGVPSQLAATKGWLGPDQWELGSTTLSDWNPATSQFDELPKVTLSVEQANFSHLGGRYYGYGVVLRNASKYDAHDVTVTGKFLDDSGERLKADRSWITAIPAGKTFYCGGFAELPRGLTPATLNVSATSEWSETASQQLPEVSDLRIVDDCGPTLKGQVTNTLDHKLTDSATLHYVLFGSDGRVVSGGNDDLWVPVRSGETKGFTIWLDEEWTPACEIVRMSVDEGY